MCICGVCYMYLVCVDVENKKGRRKQHTKGLINIFISFYFLLFIFAWFPFHAVEFMSLDLSSAHITTSRLRRSLTTSSVFYLKNPHSNELCWLQNT